MNLAEIPNPFESRVIQDAWSTPVADDESIHQEAFQECLRALKSASRGTSDSVLVYGAAGAGKTHLLTRLQRHLVTTAGQAPDGAMHCVFVSVRLQTNAQLLWQFLRRQLANDLLRRQQGLTQLQRLIAHQIAEARGEGPRHWVLAMRVLAGTDDEAVTEHLNQVAERLELERDLRIILEHLVHNRFLMDAAAWLRGDSLPEAVLDRLDLGREEPEEREDAARRIVTRLCRLAGETLPIVFCFDQVEALQSYPDDRDSLFRFGRTAADLADADPNVVLISCVQSAFLDLLNASVREADRDRIFRRRALLVPLTRQQVESLVVLRLDSVASLRALRARHPGASCYPFDERFGDRLMSLSTPAVPRKVLAAAAADFERLQRGKPLAASGDPPSRPPVVLDSFLEEEVRRRRKAALERGRPEESRDTLMHGLPMLWALRGAPAKPAAGPRTHVDLLLPADPDPLGVAICNETNMTSLAARLRHLLQRPAVQGPPPRRTVVLRDARLRIPRTAKRTQDYLDELARQGVRIVQPSQEALAALEALRTLLSDARAGDLAARGETVGEGTVSAWLARSLDAELIELIDELRGGAPRPQDQGLPQAQLLRDLGDVMWRRFVAPLDEVAAEIAASGDQVMAVARQHADQFGVLLGPPVVLFTHAPAESLAEAEG
jgi:hypothetical protein